MKLRPGVFAAIVLLGLVGPDAYAADDYPTRQIKIIVPFPAGAGPDQVARLLGQQLQDALGQAVVIENRSGALGSIGAAEVASSAPEAVPSARSSRPDSGWTDSALPLSRLTWRRPWAKSTASQRSVTSSPARKPWR